MTQIQPIKHAIAQFQGGRVSGLSAAPEPPQRRRSLVHAGDHRRHEVKMIVPKAHLHRLPMWLRVHPSNFSPVFQPRWINNVYFDTEDMASLVEGIEGDSRRMKIRLRWYGKDLAQFDRAALEFKCKIGSLGWKRTSPIERPCDLMSQSWREIVHVVRESLPTDRRVIFEQSCRPTLINRYFRSYFISFDQSVRLTLDEQLCSWRQSLGLRPNFRHARHFRGHAVLEFKAPHERAMMLSEIVESLEGRISKYSKYVTGMVGLLQADHRW